MSADLYTEYLHIPAGPRPPHYYDLLGLPLFEPDAAVIHEAVLRQSAELKRWALDPRPGRMLAVQEMLNEVNQAGFVLEDPKTKADYDRQLAAQLGVPLPRREEPAPREGEAPAEPSDSVADVVLAPEGGATARPRTAPARARACPEFGKPMAAGD
jgi:curved DNA-binding protein CbpA